MNGLIPRNDSIISHTIDKAREYIGNAKAKNTKRAYASDWKHFSSWCSLHSFEALPATPDAICLYLTELAASNRVSTIQRRLAAIGQAHQAAGHESPSKHVLVRNLLSGLRRSMGTMQQGRVPLLVETLRSMVISLSSSAAGIRDKAILLIGFAGAFRRSELVGLDVADVSFEREGVVITLKRSKTDQEGAGSKKAIPFGNNGGTCPVMALREWLAFSGITEGAIFRRINRHGRISDQRLSGRSVALVVKRTAESIGIDPQRLSGHSLRAGLATQASINGASEASIMNQTGHKSSAMVRRYIRDSNLFRDNAAGKAGL